MRAALAVALSSLFVACSGTNGPLVNPCGDAGCLGNGVGVNPGDGGPADGGDAGDGGLATDAGDGGCVSFIGTARDSCRVPGQPGQSEIAQLTATGCSGTLYLSSTPYCTGTLDGGDRFSGSCTEPGGTLSCSAPRLPGIITCTLSATATCTIGVCVPGSDAGMAADGGCGP